MEEPDQCKADAGLEVGRQPRLKRMHNFLCEVCYDEEDTKETLALSCNHRYCKDCYTAYIKQKISSVSRCANNFSRAVLIW